MRLPKGEVMKVECLNKAKVLGRGWLGRWAVGCIGGWAAFKSRLQLYLMQ